MISDVYALGAMVGVDDLDAVTFANFVCNEDGMDTISFGGTLAAAMELYEMGVIGDAETGGIALEFGSANLPGGRSIAKNVDDDILLRTAVIIDIEGPDDRRHRCGKQRTNRGRKLPICK